MIPDPDEGWSRLDPRKLLLDPVKVLGQFLVPGLIAIVGISRSDMRFWPILIPVLVIGPLVLGAIPWLTTHFRITDTQFQLRSGLLNKRRSTAPLDRVRSVDLEASLLHRILGMEKVQIGTGVDDERITLDALNRTEARALRLTLLRRAPAAANGPLAGTMSGPVNGAVDAGDGTPTDLDATPIRRADQARLLARIDWSWLRFAPFSLTRLVLLAGALGLLAQFGDKLPDWTADAATSAWDWVAQFAVALVLISTLLGGLLIWVAVAVTGYAVQWWDFRLVREGGSLHVTSGLVTTRSITVEEARVRGVELTEPVLLRLVGGAQLETLATGVGEGGRTQVLPPCPRAVAVAVGDDVLQHHGPLTAALVPHGPRARRRALLRQIRRALAVILLVGALVVWQDIASWWWVVAFSLVALPLAVAIGAASYRHLGHLLDADHVVAGSGSLARIRTVLETDGVIGWVFEQSWWQHRIGLTNLVATTAAGSERVFLRDVPLDVGVALADATTPGIVSPFLRT